jgi:hypothetical protein
MTAPSTPLAYSGLYGTPLGLFLFVVIGALLYFVRGRKTGSSQGEADEGFRQRRNRQRLSRSSFYWWVSEAAVGVVFLTGGIVASSNAVTLLGGFITTASAYVIYRRWRWRRPPR